MIKLKSLSSEVSKRFNHFEYLDNHNDTFIKCKSQNNQILEKVCSKHEYYRTKRNENISCARNNSDVPVVMTKGDICRDLQFLKSMNYPKNNISFIEKELYSGKKRLFNIWDQYQKFSFSSLSLSFIYRWSISHILEHEFLGSQNRHSLKFSNCSVIKKSSFID